MDTQKIEESYDRLESKLSSLEKIDRTRYLAAAAPVIAAAVIVAVFASPQQTQETETAPEVKLTSYQEEYVDCPNKHLEFCTRMSKIPTSEVSFIKTENGRIHLRMEDGQRMVARLPEEDHNGYLIRITEEGEA